MLTALLILAIVTTIYVLIYNSLIAKRNQIANASGSISTFLKKRADLIPNLVATVRQYTDHEEKVLTEITKLRSQTESATGNIKNMATADTQVSKMLGQIALVVENYPDLKANENYMSLQHEMTDIEDQLSAARRNYNAVVVRYNDAVGQIPTNIVARILNYTEEPVFEVSEEDARNPDVASLFKAAA